MQAKESDRLFELLKNADGGDPEDGQVRSAVNGLSAQQREKLDEILASPEKMKALLNTDAARAVMRKLGKKGS